MSGNIKNSPFKFIGGVVQAIGAYDWGGKRKAETAAAQAEYDTQREQFMNLDTSKFLTSAS